MASIWKRQGTDGKPRYCVRIRIAGRPAKTQTFENHTDAKKYAEKESTEIRRDKTGLRHEAERHTLADAIARYSADVLAARPKADCQKRQTLIGWWRKQIGAFTLDALTPPLIAEQRNRLRASKSARGTPMSAATVNRHLAELSRCLSFVARDLGWLPANPMLGRKVTRLSEREHERVRFLSDTERVELLKACRGSTDPFLFPAVLLALSSGMRAGELRNLVWADVDQERGWIVLRETKNGDARGVPLTGAALDAIKAHGKVRRLDTALVFPNQSGTGAWNYQKNFRAALDAAGVKNFRWHDLRHSAASYLAMGGATLADIAAILGHRTLAMVRRYAHLSDAHKHGVVSKMNAAIFGSTANA